MEFDAPIAVTTCEPRDDQLAAAQALAVRLKLPFLAAYPSIGPAAEAGPRPTNIQFLLTVTPERIELREPNARRGRPVFVDFVEGPTGYRRIAAGGRKQPLARAVGIRGDAPTVVDATAGLCRDAFLLAALGCRVVALERSPILHALAADGLARAIQSGASKPRTIVERIHLVQADARTWLQHASDRPTEVIYLDPMYPPSMKSAEVRREMKVLRAIVGCDLDAEELLGVARTAAKNRVVVKRLRHSPQLAGPPSHSIVGTRVRYDVYLRQSG